MRARWLTAFRLALRGSELVPPRSDLPRAFRFQIKSSSSYYDSYYCDYSSSNVHLRSTLGGPTSEEGESP